MNKEKVLNTEQIELDLICEALYLKYGYDFRNYSKASLMRRIKHYINSRHISPMSELIPLILHDKSSFSELIFSITVNVTEMFRDPGFFLSFRKDVVPLLRTFPYFKIWVAGCSTGEEVYSLVILLKEEGLLEKARIYGTDINDLSLAAASAGVYLKDSLKKYNDNYIKSGGKGNLTDYFSDNGEHMKILPDLQKNLFFANHNLATDWVFSEMHCILCRNVMIYFNRELQKRVINVFIESLVYSGILCLGKKENLIQDEHSHFFIPINRDQNIFKFKSENL